jgi:hypothetical protein
VKNSRVAKAFKDVDTRQEPRAAAQLGEYLDALERERLLKDERFLEGVVVVLERQFWSNRPDLAEDAVAEALRCPPDPSIHCETIAGLVRL